MKDLEIGKVYWIFSGQMKPFQAVLSGIDGDIALFGYIPRKVSSVYETKEEALKVGKY